MDYQTIFKRYEIKYMLDLAQKERLLEAMAPYMALDKYGRTTIRNVYYDTDNYRLIRRSIEKPVYKEKLRIRSYRQATPEAPVFVELKKKYKGVVYKRRIALPEAVAVDWLQTGSCPEECQIGREIDYFLQYYGTLKPRVFLSYEREAYYCRAGEDFRITFDENILCRQSGLSLTEDAGGTPILEKGKVLMEVKTAGGIPLWLTQVLTRERIFKASFSKYAVAYQSMVFNGGYEYAGQDF